MPDQQRFTIQSSATVPLQRLTLHNREYLTAPAVLIVCGVLNAGLITEDVLVPQDWNAVPIVIDHPMGTDGQPRSARDPDVLATCGVGHVYRARLGTGRRQGQAVATLQADLWIDIAQTQALGVHAMQVLSHLETGTALEISTAFFSMAERARGSFHGTAYEEIHHVIRPDHLALLPAGNAACNWADGCGVPRIHHQQGACACTQKETTPMTEPPVRGWRGFAAMLRQFVQTEDDTVLATEDHDTPPDETSAEAEQDPSVPATHEQEDDPMSTPPVSAVKTRVNSLITNAQSGWTETDRLMLESMNEAQLIRLEAQPRQAPATEPPKPRTFEEMLADADHEIRESHQEALENITERKQAAIALLTVNKTCPFSEDELRAMTAKRLEKLVAMSGAELPSPRADYSGRGLATPRPAAIDPATLPPEPPKVLELVVQRQKEMGLRV